MPGRQGCLGAGCSNAGTEERGGSVGARDRWSGVATCVCLNSCNLGAIQAANALSFRHMHLSGGAVG